MVNVNGGRHDPPPPPCPAWADPLPDPPPLPLERETLRAFARSLPDAFSEAVPSADVTTFWSSGPTGGTVPPPTPHDRRGQWGATRALLDDGFSAT